MADRDARGGTLVVGGGFAGAYVARLLKKRGATIVSPENFMLYTPLLPEAASGTLEPRHVVVPLRVMCPHAEFLLGRATSVDHDRAVLQVEAQEELLNIRYEKLVVAAILATAQFLAVALDSSTSGDDRATAALVAGGLLVIAGVFLDAFDRRRDAFWFHALGWFSAAAGLVFFIVEPGGDPARGWIPMLIVGTLIVIASGPIRRATWAVYGVLGYYAPLVHYMITGLNERRWTFAVALLAVGLSIFVVGLVLHRYGKTWSERFIRRPPPGVTPA